MVKAFGIGQDDEEERTAEDVLSSLGQSIGEQTPFIGGLVFGGGRIPISSAVPNLGRLGDALTNRERAPEKNREIIGKELMKPATFLLPPFGGGAVKKIAQGRKMVAEGGMYQLDDEGKKQLLFPQYGQEALDYARAMMFGPYSTREAQDYVDSGFARLTAEQTEVYDHAEEHGMNRRTAYEAIQAVANAAAPEDKSKTDLQAKREAIMALKLTPGQKAWLDFKLLGGVERDHKVNYTSMDNFKITTQLTSNDKQIAARLALEEANVPADTFIRFDRALRDAKNQPETSAAQARGAVLDEIEASSLGDKAKYGLLERLLIEDLGDSRRKDWLLTYRRQLEPEKYIRIANQYAEIDRKYEGYKAEEGGYSGARLAETEMQQYLDSVDVPEALRSQLKEDFGFWTGARAKAIPYDWSMLSSEDEKKYAGKLAATGLDITQYNAVRQVCSSFEADKDSSGKSISGSKKTKVVNYIRSRDDLTRAQQDYIIQMMGYKVSGSGSSNGKSSGKIDKPDMPKQLKKLKISLR